MASPIIVECEQRTPEWFQARAGILTASVANEMLAKPLKGGGEPAIRRDLRTRLVVERITGRSTDDGGYVSADMRRGTELEAEAVAAYETATGSLVQPVGFLLHPVLPVGCSPDGVIGDYDGGVEVKCPKMATHLSYLRSPQTCPSEYVPQVLHTLLVTGAPWWDFVSYDPRFPEELRLFVVRVHRDDNLIAEYEQSVLRFLEEVQQEQDAVAALLATRQGGR